MHTIFPSITYQLQTDEGEPHLLFFYITHSLYNLKSVRNLNKTSYGIRHRNGIGGMEGGI